MRHLIAVTKALADENRVRILGILQTGELCVCQIIELLGLAPSTVSKHLALLNQAELIDARKEGRWVYYRLASRGSSKTVRRALALVIDGLAGDLQAEADMKRIKKILKVERERLSCQQRTESRQKRSARVAAGTV